MALSKKDRRLRIKKRIRKVVVGTTAQPRLSVFRSNKEIYAQLINDETIPIAVDLPAPFGPTIPIRASWLSRCSTCRNTQVRP